MFQVLLEELFLILCQLKVVLSSVKFGGEKMERLFVKILNVALLIGGFLTLATAVVAVGFAVLSLLPVVVSNASSSHISLRYKPASEISGNVATASGGTESSAGSIPSELSDAAKDLCKAKSEFVVRASDQKKDVADNCASVNASSASDAWGDRALNFLKESTSYWRALLSDPQMSTKYSNKDETSLSNYINEIDQEIFEQFQKKVQKDEQRKQIAEAAIQTGKAGAILLGSVAVAAFMSFLFIAFLIVATRIEKHLGNIEKKTPEHSAA